MYSSLQMHRTLTMHYSLRAANRCLRGRSCERKMRIHGGSCQELMKLSLLDECCSLCPGGRVGKFVWTYVVRNVYTSSRKCRLRSTFTSIFVCNARARGEGDVSHSFSNLYKPYTTLCWNQLLYLTRRDACELFNLTLKNLKTRMRVFPRQHIDFMTKKYEHHFQIFE